MVPRTVVFMTILFSAVFGDDFDVDYYQTGLRTKSLSCKSRFRQIYCQIKCNKKPAFCVEDECYCISIAPAVGSPLDVKSGKLNHQLHHKNAIEAFVEIDDMKSPGIPHIELDSLYALRPTLRHHIAHFCPNLDVARACIRKCMTVGKPAFCGKDHVCYCGHKYTHTGKDNGGDDKAIYAQFKDMYKKYFGPNYAKKNLEV